MTKLPEGANRLDLVRQGLGDANTKKRGRLIVSLDKLREDPRNERKTFRKIEELAASIKAAGLIEPITVTPGEDNTYLIITGHRRFRAAKMAGLVEAEVLIREPDDELIRRQKSIISNVQREDIGPVEMAEALRGLMEEDPRIKSQNDLATLIGKDKAWVSGMLRILDLPENLRKEVGSTQLPVSYDTMIRIARTDDALQQKELVQSLVHGATQKEVRQRIDELKGKGSGPLPQPKPKRVFHTAFKCTVVVQAMTTRLTSDQVIAALKESLDQANSAA
ncbi:MAG: parB-like partition protein [Phycisphaerales bacterium]|nr:parB-like partition protein [Phycisphaerales bacterium]